VTRAWMPFIRILRQPRLLFTMALAGAIIFVNWQVYVIATVTGQVVEAALGYFINPIVTILIGVLVLRERLRIAQWVALGVSVIAVGVLTAGYGAVPWIALILAFSFGFYGLIKKRVGPRVDAISGLTLETMWLTPVAGVQLAIVGSSTGLTFGSAGIGHALLMMSAGIVTAVPLLLFASAARRLPLIYLGFIQYFSPVIQFLLGVFVLNEPMPPERWVGFSLIWVALIVLTVDMVRAGRPTAVPETV
jgi:chloramphenicol-sensitive protein RarD